MYDNSIYFPLFHDINSLFIHRMRILREREKTSVDARTLVRAPDCSPFFRVNYLLRAALESEHHASIEITPKPSGVSVFAQEHTLTGSEPEFTIHDWNRDRRPHQTALDVSRHIVRPLVRVLEELVVPSLGHDAI